MAAGSNIVVVGANGRLGQALQEAIARDLPDCGLVVLTRAQADLSKPGAVALALDGIDFDLLLMAAAMTDVDGCERDPELARRLNAEAPGECARLCSARGARMIHFSTDYVFDGEKDRPYSERDTPNPRSEYGRSKLAGEEQVLVASPGYLVVRLSWLFGPGGENATPDWTIARAIEGLPLKVVSDKTGSPSYSTDIASATVDLFFDNHAGGVLHLSNSGSCSWVEWAREGLRAACDEDMIGEVPDVEEWTLDECFAGKAPRPRHSVMDNGRYHELTGKTLRSWQEGTRAYVRWLASKDLVEARREDQG
jgi:dTDP-4-dehydrorhamnose reductase